MNDFLKSLKYYIGLIIFKLDKLTVTLTTVQNQKNGKENLNTTKI